MVKAAISEKLSTLVTIFKIPQVSKWVGMSENGVRRWVKDGAMPDSEKIAIFCREGDVSPNWLLLGKGPHKLSECNFDVKVASGKVAGRIGPETAKERVLAWVSGQPDEAIGWGGVEHAMMASLKDYEEWLKKRAEHGECGTTTESKSAV